MSKCDSIQSVIELLILVNNENSQLVYQQKCQVVCGTILNLPDAHCHNFSN